MTVSVLLEGVLKDGLLDEFVATSRKKLVETRASKGCISIDMTLNIKNKNNFVMTEVWETAEDYNEYRSERQKDGTSEYIISCCAEGPTIRIYDILNI